MKLFATLCITILLYATSCNTKPETVAVRALAADKGFIESEMGKHGECRPELHNAAQLCVLLNNGIAVQHAAVLALDAYCSSTDYISGGKPCAPPTDATIKADLQSKLTTAIGNLDGIVSSVKSIVGGGK